MSEARASERRGDPTTATLSTWLLPGAGHLLLGRPAAAVGVFVLVEGLYVLGWLLSHGRAFEFLDPELRGPFATLLSPEVGNLGAMIAQLQIAGFGSREPLPFPSTVHLGSLLTSLSGMANVCAMTHAHLVARAPRPARPGTPHPTFLLAAAWAVPGLGHWLQGRRTRAVLVGVLLVGFFAWGTWLAGGSNLSRERHFYYWAGQFLLGLPAILAELFSGRPPVEGELAHVDVGLLYACMPGLLNVLAMLDVHGVAERRWLGEPDGLEVEAVPPADGKETARP